MLTRELNYRGYGKNGEGWCYGRLGYAPNGDGSYTSVIMELKDIEPAYKETRVYYESIGMYTGTGIYIDPDDERLVYNRPYNDEIRAIYDKIHNDTRLGTKDIYEGDILQFVYNDHLHISPVIYDAGCFRIVTGDVNECITLNLYDLLQTHRGQIHIVGNVFQNKDYIISAAKKYLK